MIKSDLISSDKLKLQRHLKNAIAAFVMTFALIFMGGLVRISGAGMGCPDWPKCYGLWIPPTNAESLPHGYDVSAFNPVLTWIEYVNRLLGASYGLVVLIFLYSTIKNVGTDKKNIIVGVTVVLLTLFEAWLGKIVVDTELKPLIVTLHFLMAMVILLVLVSHIFTVYTQYFEQVPQIVTSSDTELWVKLCLYLACIQILLGTQVRESLENLAIVLPLNTEGEWIQAIGVIGKIHSLFGTVLVLVTWIGCYKLIMVNKSNILGSLAYLVLVLSWIQLLLGMALYIIGLPPSFQLFHQWISAWYIVVCFLIYKLVLTGKKTV